MVINKPIKTLIVLAAMAALSGCLGGSGSSDDGGLTGTSPPPPPPPPPPPVSNNPPTISGNPAPQATVGSSYLFSPDATDADGDNLTFSIANQPSWAGFDTSNGRLSGSPLLSDMGTYGDIVISVSDGSASTSLNGFSIEVVATGTGSVTLNWSAPTQNEDGTTLTDLAGYTIYYGSQSGNYTTQIPIDNPSITTYVVDGLTPDTYYFVATATDSDGIESRFSGETVRQVSSN